MFCNHKYDTVQSDGYQYCRKCGVARSVPCNHRWKIIEEISTKDSQSVSSGFIAMSYIQQCEKCGAIQQHDFNTFKAAGVM